MRDLVLASFKLPEPSQDERNGVPRFLKADELSLVQDTANDDMTSKHLLSVLELPLTRDYKWRRRGEMW